MMIKVESLDDMRTILSSLLQDKLTHLCSFSKGISHIPLREGYNAIRLLSDIEYIRNRLAEIEQILQNCEKSLLSQARFESGEKPCVEEEKL